MLASVQARVHADLEATKNGQEFGSTLPHHKSGSVFNKIGGTISHTFRFGDWGKKSSISHSSAEAAGHAAAPSPHAAATTAATAHGAVSPVGHSASPSPVDPKAALQAKLEFLLGAILSQVDTVILFDDSGSMATDGIRHGVSRLREATDAVTQIISIAVKFDQDGVDFYTLNTKEKFSFTPATDISFALARVKAYGSTPIGARLNAIVTPYLESLPHHAPGTPPSKKPLNLIVITDGEADDEDAVKKSISTLVQGLVAKGYVPKEQAGIQFLQVGNDKNAAAFLHRLDVAMKGDGDIVDHTAFDAKDPKPLTQVIQKVLLGSLVHEVDELF